MTGPKRQASLADIQRQTIEILLRLLQRQPLPLHDMVRTIACDAAMLSLVIRAAAAESASLPPDLESAIVLLGADGLRTLAESAAPWIPRRSKPVLPTRRRMRALRKAIGTGYYLVSTRAVAAAMLRDLERS